MKRIIALIFVLDRQDRIDHRQDRLERREDRVESDIRRERVEERRETRQERRDPRDQRRDEVRNDRLEQRRDRIEQRQDRVERVEDRVERREDRVERREDRIEDRVQNRNDRQQRRDHVQRDRINRRHDIERRRSDISHHRKNWREKHRRHSQRDRNHIRDRNRWSSYYNRWLINAYRPAPVYVRINWYVPMPDMNSLQYLQVEDIATNLEYVTSEVYEIMASVVQTSPNQEYAARLTRVLGQLADASENYTDAVYEGSYYEDSLYDLFHLEESIRLATQTLSGYSQEYRVAEQMNALHYYVQELLYIYRINM